MDTVFHIATAPALAATLVYFTVCWWCKIPSVHEVLNIALSRLKKLRG